MFDDLINKIDKTTENLNKNIIKQPYIIFNKVKMYFKNPSSELEIEQKNDMEFSLKYYYHNIKSNVNIESLQYKPTLTRYMRDFYENSHMECRPIKD